MIEISDISSGNIIELTQPNNLSKATLPPHHAVGFRYIWGPYPGLTPGPTVWRPLAWAHELHASHDITTRQRDDINVITLAMGEPNI